MIIIIDNDSIIFYTPWCRLSVLAPSLTSFSSARRKTTRGTEGTSWMMKGQNQGTWKTRSSLLNCALRDDEAVYWVSIGHYRAFMPLYIEIGQVLPMPYSLAD